MKNTKSVLKEETNLTNIETVREAAFALDSDIGCISEQIHTLDGVRSLLFDYKNEIEDAETITSIRSSQVKFDALLTLLNKTIGNLHEAHDDALKNSTKVFNHLVN